MTQAEERKYQEILNLSLPGSKSREEAERVAKKLWLRWKGEGDLYFFCTEILGWGKVKGPNGRLRVDPRIHKKMAYELGSEKDWLALWPRAHLKSSFMKGGVARKVLKQPLARNGMWSISSTLVEKQLGSIKDLLAEPVIRELWPDVVPDPGKKFKNWQKSTKNELTVWRDPEFGKAPQEHQVEVWGVDSRVVGHHYDQHWYDDVIDARSVTTAAQIEKVEEWWQHIQGIKDLTAIEKMVGTRYHQRDLYKLIMQEQHFGLNYTVRKAIEAGRPIYSYYTLKDLERIKRRMGERTFAQQMMNEDRAAVDRLFVPPYPQWSGAKGELRSQYYYIAVDPAPTVSVNSNWTGIAVGSIDQASRNKLYLHEAERYKLLPEKLAEKLVEKITQYRPKRVGIEYGLQGALQYIINAKLKEWEQVNGKILWPEFLPISIGNTGKADKLDRTVGAFVRESRILFKPTMRTAFMQMDSFNPYSEDNDDDLLDALSMLIQSVEYFAPSGWSNVEPLQQRVWRLEDWFKKHDKAGGWAGVFANYTGGP